MSLVSYIVNKLLPVKIVDSDLRENPFQTKIGQEVVSVQESFKARLFREGRPKTALAQGSATVPNVIGSFATVAASPGCEFYPMSVCVSAEADAELIIRIDTKLQDVGTGGIIYEVVYAKAGQPFTKSYNGEVKVVEGGNVSISILSGTATKIHGSVYGLEVVSNA